MKLGTTQGVECLVRKACLTSFQAVLKLSDVHHADVTAKEWVYGSKNLGHIIVYLAKSVSLIYMFQMLL